MRVVAGAPPTHQRECLWKPKAFPGGIRWRRGLGSAALMTVPTLRAWLSRLEASGRLAVVNRRVDPRFELTAVAKRLDRARAVWFSRVADHALPVVARVASSRVPAGLGSPLRRRVASGRFGGSP